MNEIGVSAAGSFPQLSLSHALRIKAAEYWLGLGEGREALRELDRLPKCVGGDPRVVKARVAAMRILRERNELEVEGEPQDVSKNP